MGNDTVQTLVTGICVVFKFQLEVVFDLVMSGFIS